MDCTLKRTGDRQYVYVRVHEAVTSECLAAFQTQASVLAGAHDLTLFLFDVRGFVDQIGTMETIRTVDRWKGGLPAFARVAVLISEDDTSYDFFETAAQNRSLALKCFTSESEALDWLLS